MITHPVVGRLLSRAPIAAINKIYYPLSTHPVLGGLLSPTQFQNIVWRRFQKTLARMSPNFLFEPQSQESCLGE